MPFTLPVDVLTRLWPNAIPGMVQGISKSSEIVLQKYGILTLPELTDFLAQISEETGGVTRLVENGHYSAQRAHEVWPSLFPTAESAKYAVLSERSLFNVTYNGRLGNRERTNDGYDFRGRGLIQLTGRGWYATIGSMTGLDLLGNPDLIVSPEHALECAAVYWQHENVNKFADKGDFEGETRLINGGLVNMKSRLYWREVCQKVLQPKFITLSTPTQTEKETHMVDVNSAASETTLHAAPATISSPPRVVPTAAQPVRVPWEDWLDQFLVHETPLFENLAQSGVVLGASMIPGGFGLMLVHMVGPTIVKQVVDGLIAAVRIPLANPALAIEVSSDNTIAAMAANVINSTLPSFAVKAEGLIEGWIRDALPKAA